MSKKANFSGYTVAIGIALALFCTTGTISTFSVFIPQILNSGGYTLSAVLLIGTVTTIVSFFANTFLLNKLAIKIGPKKTFMLGSLLMGVYAIILSLSQNVWMLYIAGAVSGFALAFGMTAPATMLIANWFVDKRATVTSAAFAFMSLGAAVYVFIAGQLLNLLTWRTAYLVFSAAQVVLTVLINLFLIKESPQMYGQKALGAGIMQAAAAPSAELLNDVASVSTGEVSHFKQPAFYLMYLAFFMMTAITTFAGVTAAFWQFYGMDPTMSANMLSISTLLGTVGMYICGPVTNKVGLRITIIYTAIFAVLHIFLMRMTITSMTMISVMAAIICKSFLGTISYTIPSFASIEAFGPKSFNKVLGIFIGATQIGQALFTYIIGVIVDATNSYIYVLYLLAALMIAGAFFLLAGLKLAPYNKQKAKSINNSL